MNYWTHFVTVLITSCAISSTKELGDGTSEKERRLIRYRSLLMEHFDTPRHPLINEENWLNTRIRITNELEEILYNVPNVTLETHNFLTEILYTLDEPTQMIGQNIIVTFRGLNQGRKNNKILLVGAHYDSESLKWFAINDNGSGVVAMLECVRSLSNAIVNHQVVLLNTIIFVFFDVQRSQYELVKDLEQGTGSLYYVKEKLTPILNTEPKPKFLGAIILDSIMNYNHIRNSQNLPKGFNMSFPEVYKAIAASNNTGNFLNMVVDERLHNQYLHHIFAREWNEIDKANRYPLMTLEVRHKSASLALFEFIRQDHTPFWNFMVNGTAHQPLPAILLTDTSKWRGVETVRDSTKSYNKANNFITLERLQLLDQVVLTIERLFYHHILPAAIIDSSPSIAASASFSSNFLTTFILVQCLHLINKVY